MPIQAMGAGSVLTPLSWYLTTTGSDTNGGSSLNIIAQGTTGQTFGNGVVQSAYSMTDTNASFTNSLVGHFIRINIGGTIYRRRITAVLSSTVLLMSSTGGPTSGVFNVSGGANITYVIGGAVRTWNTMFNTQMGVAPGDTVFIAPGIYRENATITYTQGQPGFPVNIIGDTTGLYTNSAPGEVQLTAYYDDNGTSGTPGTASYNNTAVLTIGTTKTYAGLAFSNITFVGSPLTTAIYTGGGNGYQGVSFTDCTILAPGAAAVTWAVPGASAASVGVGLMPLDNYGVNFERCTMVTFGTGCLSITLPTLLGSGRNEIDINMVIRNCTLMSIGTSAATACCTVTNSSGGPTKAGGVRFYNNTILGYSGINFSGVGPTNIPHEVRGNAIFTAQAGAPITAGLGTVIESYNAFLQGPPTASTLLGAGSNWRAMSPATLNFGQLNKILPKLLPFLQPLSNQTRNAGRQGAVLAGSAPVIYAPPAQPAQSAAYPTAARYPTLAMAPLDILGRARPSGGLGAAGSQETHDVAVEDTTTFYDSPASGVLVGPGDQEVLIPLDAVSNTISLQIQYDANYVGVSPPQVVLLAAPEMSVVSESGVVPAGNPGQWQQVTLPPFTPSQAGWVQVRIISYDTSGISRVNFDTLTVG